jgi:hypothetical protein
MKCLKFDDKWLKRREDLGNQAHAYKFQSSDSARP